MNDRNWRLFSFLLLLFLAIGSPVHALDRRTGSVSCRVEPSPSALVVLADWGMGNVFSSDSRTRIVRICIVVMCVALFIMLKKLNA